ncbi:type II secretion system protein [Actinotalea sp.]|uniref:type II secretion system protein n=1 Tax=Actinotalea sp. TaxID=1872145 RepID=UPI002C9D6CC2|nr:type II secretion system protein [Actinotalea sp.]HQY33853.1 type II secretion system protein [Actinotalea sp.]
MHRVVRRRFVAGPDEGSSLIEVIVAMFIFALISVGVVHTMTSVLSVSRDSRSRQVALNLAAQEIDRSRESSDDLFALLTEDLDDVVLNGDTFHIHRETQWVSDPGLDLECGSGGGTLRYKRVNVTITWDNMRSSTDAVRADTIIDPQERINDPTKGTILVSVLNSQGSGSSGVTVGATVGSPANGATALATAPSPTDSEGCSYILKVVPGNYDVTVSRSGYVDDRHAATASTTVSVIANQSTTVQFQYDRAATVTASYATTSPVPGTRIPANVATTYLGGVDPYVAQPTIDTTVTTRTLPMHPIASGYQAFAGTCVAADPEAWPDGTDLASQPISGVREPAFTTVPGGTAATNVPMGVVTVTLGGSAGGRQLRATSTTGQAATEDPGCGATPVVYSFGNTAATRLPGSGTMTVALPFGSWYLESYNGSSWVRVTQAQLTLVTTTGRSETAGGANGVVTFDPRVVAP